MVHPIYQYDPTLLPEIISADCRGRGGSCLRARLRAGSALEQGMPWWKYYSNRFLTWIENVCFGLHHTEYHTGYRASTFCAGIRQLQHEFGWIVFDQELSPKLLLAACDRRNCRAGSLFSRASSASFFQSSVYGLRILWLLSKYMFTRPAGA